MSRKSAEEFLAWIKANDPMPNMSAEEAQAYRDDRLLKILKRHRGRCRSVGVPQNVEHRVATYRLETFDGRVEPSRAAPASAYDVPSTPKSPQGTGSGTGGVS